MCARDGDGREVESRFAARENRAALIAVEAGAACGKSAPAHRDRALLLIDLEGERRVPAEIFEGRDVLGQDPFRRSLVLRSDDPQAGAEMMSAERGAGLQAISHVEIGRRRTGRAAADEGAVRNRHSGRRDKRSFHIASAPILRLPIDGTGWHVPDEIVTVHHC